MKVFIAFIAAGLIFLMLKVIRIGLIRLLNRYPALNFLVSLMIAIELIIWLAYIFRAMDLIFREKFFYSYLVYTMILIVTGFVAWFLIRDILAGIIFRIRHNLKTGSYIRTEYLSGIIKAQEITYLKIRADDGQLLRVPYSRIIHDVITELAYKGTLEEHIIRIKVEGSLGKTNAESLIRTALLNTPWSNLREEPAIKFEKENGDGYFFEITLLSNNLKRIKFIEMALEEIPSLQVVPLHFSPSIKSDK